MKKFDKIKDFYHDIIWEIKYFFNLVNFDYTDWIMGPRTHKRFCKSDYFSTRGMLLESGDGCTKDVEKDLGIKPGQLMEGLSRWDRKKVKGVYRGVCCLDMGFYYCSIVDIDRVWYWIYADKLRVIKPLSEEHRQYMDTLKQRGE